MQHREALHLVLIAVHSLVLRDSQQLHLLSEKGLQITVHCAYVTELARPLSLFKNSITLPSALDPPTTPLPFIGTWSIRCTTIITLVTLPSNPSEYPPSAAVSQSPSTNVLDRTPKISWIKDTFAGLKPCWDIRTLDSFEESISTSLDLNTQSLWHRVLQD